MYVTYAYLLIFHAQNTYVPEWTLDIFFLQKVETSIPRDPTSQLTGLCGVFN